MNDYFVAGHYSHLEAAKTGVTRLPSVTEFGDSVCSKMLSEQDRALQNSPRKLTLKLTPLKVRPAPQLREQSCSSQKKSSRNLLDYFSKEKKDAT
ncbi:hypothetical protein KIN20_011478 [Parelaphostrongylus tenuis]|uniref:Uncharacterized protein n=1 Tax=Parelaphostrongylus tenuis TaxID=148309 RepID=A0AAD5QL12_PARTN|nr:hypothetical protein KIN20_011478 [Parelaphostrongylus tenuis]